MERRRHPRGKTLYGGIVAFNSRCSTVDCVVRNFSAAGAKIVLATPVLLPHAFDLTIARKEASYRARLVWRNSLEIGMRFVADSESNVLSLDVARKVKTQKAQIETLRRRIAELTDPV